MKLEEEKEKENSERWLLTYSDMITLLLALFIMLFTMSNVDAGKYGAVAEQLGISFGLGSSGGVPYGVSEGVNEEVSKNMEDSEPSATPSQKVDLSEVAAGDKTRDDLQQMLSILVQSQDLQSDVTIKLEARGTVVSFQEVMLFDSGSATISEAGREVITKVAGIIESVDNYISVEGSTDNVPMSSGQFASNWELASQRAINVTKLLIADGVDTSRISATSYGEYRPVAENDTAENKALNRRVDIVFIDPSLNEYQAGNGRIVSP